MSVVLSGCKHCWTCHRAVRIIIVHWGAQIKSTVLFLQQEEPYIKVMSIALLVFELRLTRLKSRERQPWETFVPPQEFIFYQRGRRSRVFEQRVTKCLFARWCERLKMSVIETLQRMIYFLFWPLILFLLFATSYIRACHSEYTANVSSRHISLCLTRLGWHQKLTAALFSFAE